MEKLFLLSLFFHVSSPVEHSLKFFSTASSGIPNFPEFMMTIEFDKTVMSYCDTIKKKVEPRHDLVKGLLEMFPNLQLLADMCFVKQPNFFKAMINGFMQLFSQTGGVHILQGILVFEWDDETGEIFGFIKYGYDGEDILSSDLQTLRWKALKPEAETIKQILNAEGAVMNEDVIYDTQVLRDLLKKYVVLASDSQLKTVSLLQQTPSSALPSVSLLQKTPSSPVRCFASGFYPERASLFWRKDGDDLHEDVELGEILPNHDGTFQMSADLNISSVTPEDWRRYECVFQLFGVKDDIVTKLNKTAIRTNWGKTEIREEPSHMTVPIIASVVVLVLIAAVGFIIYRYRKKVKAPQPSPDNELSDQLNQTPL